MFWRRLHLLVGGLIICSITLAVLWGFVELPRDPTGIDVSARLQPPSQTHWLGTDHLGRDLLSRLMVGGRVSLAVGSAAAGLGLAMGLILGTTAGVRGGLWDEGLMRLADGLYAFPPFLLAVLAVTIWSPGGTTAMAAITLGTIPSFMRLSRNNTLQLRESPYIEAARAIGAGTVRIVLRHMLPNMLRPLLVQASVAFAAAVLAEASLSYLGVGTQPPMPSWGRMLRDAQGFAGVAPWAVLAPGAAIAWTVLGFNILGDGLQKR